MKRPVPIAPPRPIITTCALLKAWLRPRSRSMIAGSGKRASSDRDERQRAQWTARTLLDLERRREQDRARGRQQIEIGQALQAIAARAVHVVVTGIRRIEVLRLTSVRADRLRPEAEHIALLDEEPRDAHVRARCVLAGVVEILVGDRIAA